MRQPRKRTQARTLALLILERSHFELAGRHVLVRITAGRLSLRELLELYVAAVGSLVRRVATK